LAHPGPGRKIREQEPLVSSREMGFSDCKASAERTGTPAATRTRDPLLRRLLKPYQECDLLKKLACFLGKSRGADPGVSVRWRSGGIISGITECDPIGADLLLNKLFVEGAVSIIPPLYHLTPNRI